MDIVHQNGSNYSTPEALSLFKYIVNPNDTEYVPIGQLGADFYGVEFNLQDLTISFIPKEIKARTTTSMDSDPVLPFTRVNRINNYCNTRGHLYGYGLNILELNKKAKVLALPSNIYKKVYTDAFRYFLDENKDVVRSMINAGLDINNHTYLISSYFVKSFTTNTRLINEELTLLYFDKSKSYASFKNEMGIRCKVMNISYNEVLALSFNYGKLKPFSTFTELDELIQESVMEI